MSPHNRSEGNAGSYVTVPRIGFFRERKKSQPFLPEAFGKESPVRHTAESNTPLREPEQGWLGDTCAGSATMPTLCCGIAHPKVKLHSAADCDHLQPPSASTWAHFLGRIRTDGDISQLHSQGHETWHIPASFLPWRKVTFKKMKYQLYESQSRDEREKGERGCHLETPL